MGTKTDKATTDFSIAIGAVSRLTRRWSETFASEENTVASGVGAWLVLSAALSGSVGKAQLELEEALGVPKADAAALVRSCISRLRSDETLRAALALWTKVPIHREFASSLDPLTVAAMPESQAELDRWAARETGGLIDRFPCEPSQETYVILASALAAEADWVKRFDEGYGHWRGRSGYSSWLSRSEREFDEVTQLWSGGVTVTRVVCESRGGFDVHLLGGSEEDGASTVLGLGLAALDGNVRQIAGGDLGPEDVGGCLRFEEVRDFPGRPLRLSLPRFDIRSNHDLMNPRELLGLSAAADLALRGFPGISAEPLAIEAVAQSAMADFTAEGFRAAAVTVDLDYGAALPQETQIVRVRFDRPFGFLVVDRSTGLVLFAGWVADVPIVEPDYGFEDPAPQLPEDPIPKRRWTFPRRS